MFTRLVPVLLGLAPLAPATASSLGPQPGARQPAGLARLQEPATALRALELGLKDSDPAVRRAALQAHGPTTDARALALVLKALRDPQRDVRFAAVETLRFSDSDRALDGLHRMARTDRSLAKDPELHAALYKAIGHHGEESSIAILASELLVRADRDVTRAGILSIANIRSKSSLEALLSLMRSAGRSQVQANMPTLRLALVVLSGSDQGLSQDRWNTWWNDSKRTVVVAPTLPQLTEDDRRAWDAHWGIRRQSERATRRHERGSKDPE